MSVSKEERTKRKPGSSETLNENRKNGHECHINHSLWTDVHNNMMLSLNAYLQQNSL
jgi:hypothetical protein